MKGYPKNYLDRLQKLRDEASKRGDTALHWAIDVAVMQYLDLPDLADKAVVNMQHARKD